MAYTVADYDFDEVPTVSSLNYCVRGKNLISVGAIAPGVHIQFTATPEVLRQMIDKMSAELEKYETVEKAG